MYSVNWSKTAAKELRRLPSRQVAGIVRRVTELQRNPRPSGCKKLEGYENLYRLRHGDYRVLYQIQDTQLIVIVIEVGHRKDVYRSY